MCTTGWSPPTLTLSVFSIVPSSWFISPMKSATNSVCRLGVDLRRRADLLDDTVVHHHDPVGHGERLFLIVCHHDRRYAKPLLQRLDLVAQMHAHLGIKRRQGLIKQQQSRRCRQRTGERNPLLLATGQLGGILLALIRQSDQLQQVL